MNGCQIPFQQRARGELSPTLCGKEKQTLLAAKGDKKESTDEPLRGWLQHRRNHNSHEVLHMYRGYVRCTCMSACGRVVLWSVHGASD